MRAFMLGILLLGTSQTAKCQSISESPGDPGSRLRDIVGTWQSDTVNGTSARSTCARSPDGGAVICDQVIASATGVLHEMSFFVTDSAGAFVFYNLARPGATMRPVRLVIARRVWTYGGAERGDDGRFHHTVNVFGSGDGYTWRQESSSDGVTWVPGVHGQSRRVR